VVRCAQCMLALAYSRATATLACRLCGRTEPLPDTCPSCRGRRLSPFGWGVERVEHAVRRRFPDARIARYDPDALRGARGETQRRAAAAAQVVIGTRGALRLFGRAELGYPPFRRLAIVTLRGGGAPETERLAERVCAALRASTALQIYPPGADRRSRVRRVVVKGPAELPRLVGAALQEFRDPRPE